MRSSVQPFFDELTGRAAGAGGSARSAPPINALAQGLLAGIVRPEIGSPFQAPAIGSAPEPRPPAPYPQEREPSPQQVPFQGISGGGRDLGGGAKAAGLQRLGQGIESALGDWAAKRKAQQEAAGIIGKIPGSNPVFGQPSSPTSTGATPGQDESASTPYTPENATRAFGPVGSVNDVPIFGQPAGQEARGAVPPIGGGGASLPTFAQGMPRSSNASLIDPQYDPKGLGAGLQPRFADTLQDTLQDVGDQGISSHIISGLRTPGEQAALYAQGRTAPGPIVTNAPPGSSYHNWGAAADVSGTPSELAAIGAAGKNLGLAWGGDFRSIKDLDHLQMPGSLAEARAGAADQAPGAPPAAVASSFNPIAGSTSDMGAPSRAYADSNPGNIKYGSFARDHGATNADEKGFAIFPDAATGRSAQEALWNTSRYADVPLSSALKTWSGGGYTPQKLGFDPDQTFSGMSPEDQQRLLDRQQQFEGWKPGAAPPSTVAQAPPAQTGSAAYAATLPTSDTVAPAMGASNVPMPPPRPDDSQLGPQSMNDQGINPLAAALAGGGDPNSPVLAPGIVDALNAQPFGFDELFGAPAPELGDLFNYG